MESWSRPEVPRLPAAGRPLRLHDTATGEVRPTAPGATARRAGYSAVAGAPGFGYESGLDVATMTALFAARGGGPNRAGKKHALDPALWLAARPGEPCWPGEPGQDIAPGRPGWHVECAAI